MRVFPVDPEEPAMEAVDAAVEALRSGELVILPTETVYGLACDAHNADAIERVYAAKGRSERMPLPVQVADASQLRALVAKIPEEALRAAAKFWPGPLTLVLKRRPEHFAAVAAGGDTVAVRIPRHPIPLAVLGEFGGALVVTSANKSGEADTVTAEDAADSVGEHVAVVLEAGPSPIGQASTVLDVTGDKPKILRRGSITIDELSAALGVEVEA